MFKFYRNGKEIKNQSIEWKFVSHPTQFSSMPERLERNVSYWRNKLGLKEDVEIQILNADAEIEVPTTINPKEYESIINQSDNQSSDDIVNEEPSVSEDVADTVSAPKRKPAKKTSKL